MTTDSSTVAASSPPIDHDAKYQIDVRGFDATGRSFQYAVYTRMSERGMAQLGGTATELPKSFGTPSEIMKIVS